MPSHGLEAIRWRIPILLSTTVEIIPLVNKLTFLRASGRSKRHIDYIAGLYSIGSLLPIAKDVTGVQTSSSQSSTGFRPPSDRFSVKGSYLRLLYYAYRG